MEGIFARYISQKTIKRLQEEVAEDAKNLLVISSWKGLVMDGDEWRRKLGEARFKKKAASPWGREREIGDRLSSILLQNKEKLAGMQQIHHESVPYLHCTVYYPIITMQIV